MLTDCIDQCYLAHPPYGEQIEPSSDQPQMQLSDPVSSEPLGHSDPQGMSSQSITTSGGLGGLAGSCIPNDHATLTGKFETEHNDDVGHRSKDEDLRGPSESIIQDNTNIMEVNVKTEPVNDSTAYKHEPIDLEPMPSNHVHPGSTPEHESAVAAEPVGNETASENVPQQTKSKEQSPRAKYSESFLEETINKIRNRTLSVYAASRITGIPRTTLQYRLSAEYKNKGTRGPYCVFTKPEEKEIATWIIDMARKGFPFTRTRVEYIVVWYLKTHPRKNSFRDSKPGKQWIHNFIKRNTNITLMKQLSLDATDQDVHNWYRGVLGYLEDNQLTHILKDPSRILTATEAGFTVHLTKVGAGKIQSPKMSFIETTNGNHNVTVMFTHIANGSDVPPNVLVRTKRVTQDQQQYFPSDWWVARSESGEQDVRNFTMYVKNVLHPTLVERDTDFPVLYFVDGHKSEIAFETADMCKYYGIILIALYPNAAKIQEQSDVGALKQLKNTYNRSVKTWRSDHKSKRFTLSLFASTLVEAMTESLNESAIRTGFTISGLYPFSSSAIDFDEYKKLCIPGPTVSNGSVAYSSHITDHSDEMPRNVDSAMDFEDDSMDRKIAVPESILKTALTMLGPSKIHLYRTTPADNLSDEDKVLSYVFKNILILGESPARDTIQESSRDLYNFMTYEISEPTNVDCVGTEFVATKTENDSEESSDMILGSCDYDHCDKIAGKVPEQASGNCQQNEVGSTFAEETSSGPICFATEHICSFPRVTTHFCPVTHKMKYHSFLLDLTGMYVVYLDSCQKSAQEPVPSKVYNAILLKEHAKDPPLPFRCDDCQYVEKLDLGETRSAYSSK